MAESAGMWSFKYEQPEVPESGKKTAHLGKTDLLILGVQTVLKNGGETNMHAHSALDSAWYVLAGTARFYGYGDELIAEAGKDEGVFIPRGVPYWFEASSEEPLQILHITAVDKSVLSERVDYAPPAGRRAARRAGQATRRPRSARTPTDAERERAAAGVPHTA